MKKLLSMMAFVVVAIVLVFYMSSVSKAPKGGDTKVLDQDLGSSNTENQNIEFGDSADFEEILKILLTLKAQEENKGLPRSMAEVKITPELQAYLDEWPGGYDKLEYRLGLFDRLSRCLGGDAPESGKVYVLLPFKVVDPVTKEAIGEWVKGEPFSIKRTTLSEEENKIVSDCLLDTHVGFPFNAFDTLTKSGYPDEKEFTHPIEITFPIEDDILYDILENGPRPSP